MHIIKFAEDKGQLVLQGDTFDQLKPGLSSYADKPQQAAQSLKPLLDLALKTVPAPLHVRPAHVAFVWLPLRPNKVACMQALPRLREGCTGRQCMAALLSEGCT